MLGDPCATQMISDALVRWELAGQNGMPSHNLPLATEFECYDVEKRAGSEADLVTFAVVKDQISLNPDLGNLDQRVDHIQGVVPVVGKGKNRRNLDNPGMFHGFPKGDVFPDQAGAQHFQKTAFATPAPDLTVNIYAMPSTSSNPPLDLLAKPGSAAPFEKGDRLSIC